MKKYHLSKRGEKILISELDSSHLLNILKLISRKSEEGVFIAFGSAPPSGEPDFYEDEIVNYEALEELNFLPYFYEFTRRLRAKILVLKEN